MAVSAIGTTLFAMEAEEPGAVVEVLEPDWATEILAWSTTVLAAATVILAIAAMWGLRAVGEAKRARNVDVMMELSRRWDSSDAIDRRARIAEYIRHDPNEGPHPRELSARDRFKRSYEMIHMTPAGMDVLGQANFFEDLAILVRARGIDVNIVSQSLGAAIVYYWNLWKPAIHFIRDTWHEQGHYKNFESLAVDLTPYWPKSAEVAKSVEVVANKANGGEVSAF